MFCMKCGNEISDGAAFCMKCGTKVVTVSDAQAEVSKNAGSTDNVNEDTQSTENNPDFEDVTYHLESTTGLRFGLRGKVYSDVMFGEKSFKVHMRPEKLNRYSEIAYSDVTNIRMSYRWSWDSIVLAVATCFTVVLLLWNLWAGLNYKFTITLKNGDEVVVYHLRKKGALMFKEEIEKRCGLWSGL